MLIQPLRNGSQSPQSSPTMVGLKRAIDEEDDMELMKKGKEEGINNASDALPSPAAEPLGSMEVEDHMIMDKIAPLLPITTTLMTREQIRYATAIIRNLKKHRDASPFLHPVDYMSMKVADYPTIISRPMDLNTVDRKLADNEYNTVDDFVADVRLVFSNCYKYNGPEATISMLCQNVESAFEKGLRQMPPSKELSPSLTNSPGSLDGNKRSTKVSSPSLSSSSSSSSSSVVVNVSATTSTSIRRISEDTRPKREIHPPPSKDYPETYTRKRNPRTDTAELKFCGQTIREMKKSKYKAFSYPFLAPVDHVALNIPDYPTIVKEPMDLSTIETKWNQGDYLSADHFEKDVRLMFNNCYLYNPPTLPVHQMARNLEKIFDEKWQQKPSPVTTPPPPPPPPSSLSSSSSPYATSSPLSHSKSTTPAAHRRASSIASSSSKKTVNRRQRSTSHADSHDEDEDDDDERIAELERHIANIAEQIKSMKSGSQKKKTDSRQERRRRPSSASVSHTKNEAAATTAAGAKRKRVRKPKQSAPSPPLPEFTFQQKSELSERINNLTGDKLTTVVQIIQSSMPNLDGGGQDEIVLDIDLLDRKTLHQLHEFVTGKKLTRTQPQKRSRKRFSDVDSDRKIKELEQKLREFESTETSSESESSSDSETDDDSSDSD